MIQQEYKNNVEEVSGEVKTTGFSIEVNESMFQMLTVNVYNDPILAVIREWSTNACDACIDAGKEVKFDVHLPSLEKPTFSVRDYGTGLAPKDIMGLFSNLGASTKRNSDAFNGTLGIGRMAGLAVSNAFTVESFHNGTKHSYAISMQKGVPVTMHLGDNPTVEPNGLLLSVNVDTDDIHNYSKKAEYLYKYFDHKPDLNRDDLNIYMDTEEHISDDWFIEKTSDHFSRTNYVVMSQVPYAIPDNYVVENQGFRNLVIKAPPGAVTFNPGRESLSLDKPTVKYLNEAFKKVADDYVNAATIALATTTTDKELVATYNNLVRAAPSPVAQKIDMSPFTSTFFENLYSSPYYSSNQANSEYLSITNKFETDTAYTLSISYKDSYYKTSKTADKYNTLPRDTFFSTTHVIVDMKTKFRKALNDKFVGKVLITWNRNGKADIDEAVDHAKRYLDGMGIKYQMASELVDEEEVKAKAPREGMYVSKLGRNKMLSATKMEEDDIIDGTYLYLKMKNTTPDIPENSTYNFDDYVKAYNVLSAVDTETPPVRGVAKKYQSVVDDLDNWVDFQTYIEDKMKEQTFKVDMDSEPRTFQYSLASEMWRFPQDIKDYNDELDNYKKFKQCKSYICDPEVQDIVKRFGSEVETYEWDEDQSEIDLSAKYPKAWRYLIGLEYTWKTDPEFIAYITKLEEYYAIHSSK